MKKAKITPEELGAATRKAFDEHQRQLEATKKEVKVIDGTPVEVQHPDNNARMRAVESMYDLAGVRTNRQASGGGPTFVINLPDYYDPDFVKRDKPGKVIDVTPEKPDDN